MAERIRIRIPRAIRTGARPHAIPGARLTCLVLGGYGAEFFGIELESGAFVRVIGAAAIPPSTPGSYRVVEITIEGDSGSIDPARPELLVASTLFEDLGEIKRRRTRRLFRLVAASDHPGATVLGTRGPSVAYVDLDGTSASLTLLDAKKADLELLSDKDTAYLAITFGGVTQRFPVYDRRVLDVAARIRPRSIGAVALDGEIGFRVGYVLIGLSAVEGGHVRKAVFVLLARNR
jgi:hypothetical protein